MKKTILYLFATLFALTGCDKELHEVSTDNSEGKSILSIGLNTDKVTNVPLRDIHLFWFDETDQLVHHEYYGSMEELAQARLAIPAGNYTGITVMNTEKDFVPPTGSMDEVTSWIREQASNYPDLLTGTLRHTAKEGRALVYIDLEKGTGGLNENPVKLLLAIPSPRLPDFVSARSAGTPALRGVAYIFKKGTKELFTMKRAMLSPVSGKEGVYSMGLSLFKGEYDINLWVDYTTSPAQDNHYITSNTDIVQILEKTAYKANSDTRDAFAKRIAVSIAEGENTPKEVEMHRPLAKYRLVATDVEQYERIRTQRGYPALQDLKIEIGYEGFLPNSYSIGQSKPADSGTGYKYASALSEEENTKVTVGKDYIFVNGTQSFVTVTILFKNSEGKLIGGVRNVRIDYRAGQLTTVSGDFLTTGLGSGITIDTKWDDEDYNVNFDNRQPL